MGRSEVLLRLDRSGALADLDGWDGLDGIDESDVLDGFAVWNGLQSAGD